MFQTIHNVHYQARPWLLTQVDALRKREGKHVVHIRSPRELRAFVR